MTTLKESQQQYKEAIIENRKPKQNIEDSLWEEFEKEVVKTELKSNVKIVYPKDVNHQEFWDKFLTEKFPEGGINKVLEKNFAIWICQNNVNIDDVKAKYKDQKWNAGSLLGWVKKVNAGEIVEYNIGEIVNWAKANKPDLIELLKTKEIEPKKEEKKNLTKEFEVIWEKDLKNYEVGDLEWVTKNLIPFKAVGVWTGKRGTFKTFLTLSCCFNVARGENFLGSYPCRKLKVLYLDKENGTGIMKQRTSYIKKGLNINPDDDVDIGFICFSHLKIDKSGDILALEEVIQKEGIGLLVVDTYRRGISFDENDAGEVSHLFVDVLRPLVERNNLSIILIHHDRKGNGQQNDEMDEIRGSSDLANYCDFILKNERKGKGLILKQLKCRNAPEIEPVEVQMDTDEESTIVDLLLYLFRFSSNTEVNPKFPSKNSF